MADFQPVEVSGDAVGETSVPCSREVNAIFGEQVCTFSEGLLAADTEQPSHVAQEADAPFVGGFPAAAAIVASAK